MFREKAICDAIRTAYLHLFPDKKERKRALSRLDLELVAQGVRYRGENVLAYSRLSVGDEDRDGGESNSIQNQKIFLENYARGQHLTNIRHYIDDDESGRFFDRSAYSRMMDDVENG